jgi:hypothetical protein
VSTGAIGGYFELELSGQRNQVFPEALRFQSARSAFYALLRAARPSRVWMPRYLCDTMYAPLQELGIDCQQYSIDESFDIVGDPGLGDGEWLYYVNYFGVHDSKVDAVLAHFGRERVVVDNCQAFFSKPRECVATIYSPRKFFGVPDGGLLLTSIEVELPEQRDTGSLMRSAHLVERMAGTPEAGYASYKAAEHSLEQLAPRRMSQLTDAILSTVDLDRARSRRNENFRALHTELASFNRCALDAARIDGPLCYPLLIDAPGLREHLIASRVFVATYWPDVRDRVESTAAEATLVDQVMPLPCDQRYGAAEMVRVAQACLDFLKQ